MQRSIIAPAERVTNLRWAMAALVGVGLLIAGCDQVNLAVNGGVLRREFSLDDSGFGLLLSTFGWAYAIAQVPFGWILDRIGVARTGRFWTFAWGIVAVLTAFASTLPLLLGANALLGIARSPAQTAAAKATGYWFPVSERSTGTAFFDAGQKLSLGIGIPVMAWIGQSYGWRTSFLVIGIAGIVYAIAFFVFYRDPADSTVTYAEKQHLAQGDAQVEGPPGDVNVFALPKVWGLTIGYFAYAFAFFLYVTWLPSYVARTFHIGIFPTAIAAGAPWIVAALASLLIGGRLVDATGARKPILIIGMLLGLATFGVTTAHDQNVALICIAVTIFGLGVSGPVAWSLPSLIAPRGRVGAVASMMNCAGALGAILAPITAGYLLTVAPGFEDVFFVAGVVLLIGIASYVFLLGRIEPAAAAEPAGILI
jgi:MFS family permease